MQKTTEFKTKEEMMEWGKENLGKYGFIYCNVGDQKYMLCGTPLAYEDDVWNTSARFIKEMQEVLGLPRFDENNARYMDLIPEVRDYLLEKITDIEGIEIVHVSEEY